MSFFNQCFCCLVYTSFVNLSLCLLILFEYFIEGVKLDKKTFTYLRFELAIFLEILIDYEIIFYYCALNRVLKYVLNYVLICMVLTFGLLHGLYISIGCPKSFQFDRWLYESFYMIVLLQHSSLKSLVSMLSYPGTLPYIIRYIIRYYVISINIM